MSKQPDHSELRLSGRRGPVQQQAGDQPSAVSLAFSLTSGPIPSPEALAHYEQTCPGIADRIFKLHERQITLTEEQAQHRFYLEKKVVGDEHIRAQTGTFTATGITLFALGVSAWLGVHGHDWLAGSIATIDLVSLVGVFIYGSQSRRTERESRMQVLLDEQKMQKRLEQNDPSTP